MTLPLLTDKGTEATLDAPHNIAFGEELEIRVVVSQPGNGRFEEVGRAHGAHLLSSPQFSMVLGIATRFLSLGPTGIVPHLEASISLLSDRPLRTLGPSVRLTLALRQGAVP